MTKLEVLFYDTDRLHSRCRVLETDEEWVYVGQNIAVDLTVNADFGDMPEESLVGKSVICERLQPCEYIGVRVSVV